MTTDTMNQMPNGERPRASTDTKPAAAAVDSQEKTRPRYKYYWLAVAVLLLVAWLFAFFISRAPAPFDVRTHVEASVAGPLKPGAATTSAVIEVVDTLLNKPGGYLSNDLLPPMLLLDNMPNWEFGVLTEIRDVVRAMRNDFSRTKSQSGENKDLAEADPQFHFDNGRWILPSSEQEYRQGRDTLQRYLTRLQSGQAEFYPRADNLNFYLATVEKRLGNFSQRLSESVREPFLRELILNNGQPESQKLTPWLQIDDVFFETRGYAWALLHVLKAIEIDFADVLASKNATLMLRQIIENLEHTQHRLFSPMVLNSTGFGMLTNHSLVMASYISRANAALIDLRLQLTQG